MQGSIPILDFQAKRGRVIFKFLADSFFEVLLHFISYRREEGHKFESTYFPTRYLLRKVRYFKTGSTSKNDPRLSIELTDDIEAGNNIPKMNTYMHT